MKNIFDLFKKNKGTTSCPYCGSHNTNPIIIHTKDTDYTFNSYDMICKNCGKTFIMRDR